MRLSPIATIIAISMFLAGEAVAHPAWGIAVDNLNQVYFTDLETVWKIDARGHLTVFRQGVSGRHTHEINLDANGSIYGVDNSYEPSTQRFFSALWKMTPAGEFSYVYAPTHTPPKGMTIWKDSSGNTYYVGQSENSERAIFVLKRTPAGRVTTLAGNKQAGDEHRQVMPYGVGGVAFGANDTLFFTADNNVQKVAGDGRLTLIASASDIDRIAGMPVPLGDGLRLFGIAVDKKDTVFVADHSHRRVLKIGPANVRQAFQPVGERREQVGEPVLPALAISTVVQAEPPWSPTGVAWKDGSLYLLESGFKPPTSYATRVRKLSPDGKITVLATLGENLTGQVSELAPATVHETAHGTNDVPYFLVTIGLGAIGVAAVIWWFRRSEVV